MSDIYQSVQDAVALSKRRGEQVTLVGPPNLRAAILKYLIVEAADCDDYDYYITSAGGLSFYAFQGDSDHFSVHVRFHGYSLARGP